MVDGDTMATMQDSRDMRDVMAQRMTQEELMERRAARGFGALGGALPYAGAIFGLEAVGVVSGRMAGATLPEGLTASAMGRAAGFPAGVVASREALRRGLPALASGVRGALRGLRQAGVSRYAVRQYARFYRQAARDNPANPAALFRSRVLWLLKWIY